MEPGKQASVSRGSLDAHASHQQDLFVPPYIKDRCKSTYKSSVTTLHNFLTICYSISRFPDIASTSPPNSRGFVSSSVSSTTSFPDYEVEVVEIRVDEGYLSKIIP